MEMVTRTFEAPKAIAKNEDPLTICNMKPKKIALEAAKTLIDKSIVDATEFASMYIKDKSNEPSEDNQ